MALNNGHFEYVALHVGHSQNLVACDALTAMFNRCLSTIASMTRTRSLPVGMWKVDLPIGNVNSKVTKVPARLYHLPSFTIVEAY